MRQITGPAERKKFYQLHHEEGKTYEEIAEMYGVSSMCVRMWCRRQRDGGGVENRYYNPRAGTLNQFDARIQERILELRRAHPRWGPESILLHLKKEPEISGKPLPGRSSVARFLHEHSEFRRLPKKKSM